MKLNKNPGFVVTADSHSSFFPILPRDSFHANLLDKGGKSSCDTWRRLAKAPTAKGTHLAGISPAARNVAV